MEALKRNHELFSLLSLSCLSVSHTHNTHNLRINQSNPSINIISFELHTDMRSE
jgi:hypothetical protein